MATNGDTLLNYVLKLDVRTPTADANADYLRAAVVVVKPLTGVETGVLTKVISATAAAALTDNKDIEQLFAAGMNSVYILPMDDLDLADALAAATERFKTVLISSDFSEADIAELEVGSFTGVVAAIFTTQVTAKAFGSLENRVAWFNNLAATKGKNAFYAWGSFLSGTTWSNNQYISLPVDDGIIDLGVAESLFNDRISFALTSEQYGPRLAFFGVGGQAIIAPYITEELMLNLQGAALRYLNLNRPQYTLVQAKLLEDYLNADAAMRYVLTNLLSYVAVTITLTKTNYEGTVAVSVPEPSALWRLAGILTQEAFSYAGQ